jgi:hypothetical protein
MTERTFLFTVLLGLPGLLGAQVTGTYYPAALQADLGGAGNLSARASVLGVVDVSLTKDPNALSSNPAGLAALDLGSAVFHSRLEEDGAVQGIGALGLPVKGFGGIGFSVGYLDHGTMEGRDLLGSLAPDYTASRVLLQAGAGMRWGPWVSGGLSLQYSRQEIDGTGYSYLVPRLGAIVEPSTGWKVGASYLRAIHLDWSGPEAWAFQAATSLEFPLDPSARLLAGLGASFQSNFSHHLQTGLEATLEDKYFLRAGYKLPLQPNGTTGLSGFSAGGGLSLGAIVLDYAFLAGGELQDSHRFSVTYPFPSQGASKGKGSTPSTEQPPDARLEVGRPVSPGGEGKASDKAPSLPALPGTSTTTVLYPGPPDLPPQRPSLATTPEPGKDPLNLHFDIPPDHVAKGAKFESQGHYAQAVEAYKKALQEEPQDLKAWWALGNLYARAGQKAAAIQCLERALTLRPDNQALRQWLDKYKKQ